MSKSLASKSFTNPDVLKEPDKTHSASVDLGVATATKLVPVSYTHLTLPTILLV